MEINIDKIKPYEKNAKKHPKEQITKIANSIKAFGFNQPVVVDKNNIIIVGHGRYYAALELGLKKVPYLKVNLSDKQAKAYRLADNKLNESSWDINLVIEELKGLSVDLIDLSGFDIDLITDIKEKDDEFPEMDINIKSKIGDLYQLGNHFVYCGDSTKKEDVEKLMKGEKAQMCFTDPPYNVNYTGGMSATKKNKRKGILNDKMSTKDFYIFLSLISERIIENVKGGVYICMSSSEIHSLKNAWEEKGGHWQSFIIWVKNNFTLSRADYQNMYEPILYGWNGNIKNHFFSEDRNRTNVWEDLRKVKTEFKDGYTTISFK